MSYLPTITLHYIGACRYWCRGSLEEEEEALNLLVGPDAAVGDPPAECAEAAVRSAFWCRSVAVTVWFVVN
jgi:hypothetical protein